MNERDTERYNLEQAEEILKPWIQEDGSLDSGCIYSPFEIGSPEICLDGRFTADQLEALSVYMIEAKKEDK